MNNYTKLLFEDCVRVEQDLYFICRDYNLLCKMNIDSGNITIIDSIPDENAMAYRLGSKIIYWKDELFFSPMSAVKIWRYNLITHEWKGYKRKKINNWTEKGDMFQAVLYKDKIYFIGAFYPAIIVLDLIADSLKYIEAPYLDYKSICKEKKDSCFRTDYVQIDNLIYIASCVKNVVLRFNLDTYEHEYITVGKDNYMYSGIDWDGTDFYLSPRKHGPIVIWNGKDRFKTIDLPFNNSENRAIFGGVICRDEKVYFPACFTRTSLVLNDKTDIKSLSQYDAQYLFYKKIDDKTIASLTVEGKMEILLNGNRYEHYTRIDNEILGKYLSDKMKKTGEKLTFEKETEKLSLGLFINMI